MTRFFAFLIAVLLVADAALAGGVRVPGDAGRNGCIKHELCVAQTATGACGSTGAERYASVGDYWGHTFTIASSSTASTISCTVYYSAPGEGYDSADRNQVNATALSTIQRSFQHAGALGDTWIECGTITGGNVTVFANSCPLSR